MKKKKLIVYIITELELGGAQKVCLALFNNVANDDYDTALITSQKGLLAKELLNRPNVFMIPHLQRNMSIRSLMYELRAFVYMYKILRTLKASYQHVIVHTHSTKAGILGRWAAWFARIPVRIHTVHGYAMHPHQSWISWLLIYLIELSTSLITTHFVCVSSADVKTGNKLFPRFRTKHAIIRAAVDMQRFAVKITAAEPSPFIFGAVACFKPQKNLLDLLKAFTTVHQKHPATRLEIIGDGIMRPELEQYLAQHNLTNQVTLHGWQSNIVPIMQQWHAFTLSSLWEGLPCAIIEARLLHLPVVCYNTGGIADVISHGNNGLLCEQKKWQQLAHYMLAVATDKPLYTRLTTFNDQLDAFSYQAMISEHRTLYYRFV